MPYIMDYCPIDFFEIFYFFVIAEIVDTDNIIYDDLPSNNLLRGVVFITLVMSFFQIMVSDDHYK